MKTLKVISTFILMNITMTALSNKTHSNESIELTLQIVEIIAPTCHSTPDGSVTVEASGGKAPYSYNWNSFPNQSTAKAVNLAAGVYFVEVTDAEGEKYFQSVELTGPNMNSTTVGADNLSANPEELNLFFSIEGGNAPYTYTFNDVAVDEPVFEDLPIGIHKMVVTDANHCSMVQYIQIFELNGDQPETEVYGWNKEKSTIQAGENRILISPLIPIKKKKK